MASVSSVHHLTIPSDVPKNYMHISMAQIHEQTQSRLLKDSGGKNDEPEKHPNTHCEDERGNGSPYDAAGYSSGTDGPLRKRRRSRKGLDKKFACAQPGCGKTYSRAEHLHRHQLNHSPKQIYSCDFPDCDRKFVRLDLCNRHKDRHIAKGSYLNRTESKHKYVHDSLTIQTEKTSLGRSSSSPEVAEVNTHELKFRSSSVVSAPYGQPQDRPHHSPSSFLSNSIGTFPSSASLQSAENFSFKLSLNSDNYSPKETNVSNTSARNSPQPSPNFGVSQVKQDEFVRPALQVKLEPYGLQSSVIGPPNYNHQSNSQESLVSPQDFSLFSLPPMYYTPSTPNPVVNLEKEPPFTTSVIGSEFASENLSNSSADLLMLNQTLPVCSTAVFGGEGCNRSLPITSEEFLLYLFNKHTTDQMGRLVYSNHQSASQYYCPYSSYALANLYSHNQQTQRRMDVTSLLDTTLPETVISEEKSQTIVTLIKTRFNQDDHTSVSSQKETFLEGDRNEEKHLLSRYMMQKYIGSYWYHFSGQVPILHKPTFAPDKTPNPLLIAMMIIGASSLRNDPNSDFGHRIGELSDFLASHLRWELFSDHSFRPPAKLWVFQALLLLEFYEKIYSTRTLHERAHIHHATTITLMRRGSSLIGRSAMDTGLNAQEYGQDGGSGTQPSCVPEINSQDEWWSHWVANESTRRAAFVAFLIDSTHATMFRHSTVMFAHEMQLPLPCNEDLWSAPNSAEVGRIEASLRASGVKPISFLEGLKRTLNSQEVQTNPFGRTILMAGLLSVCWHMNQRDLQFNIFKFSDILGGPEKWKSCLAQAFDFWNQDFDRSLKKYDTFSKSHCSGQGKEECFVLQTKTVLHHLAHMALHVDIVDCQILARAKRLLGRTICPQDVLKVQSHMKDRWAPTSKARDATWHALQFLYEVFLSEESSLSVDQTGYLESPFLYSVREDLVLNRSWVLYFAALIVWSYGYALEGPLIRTFPEKYSKGDQVREMQIYLKKFCHIGSAEDLKNMKGFNECTGLLLVLREVFRKARWELLQEAANLLNNCIQLLGGLSV